MKNLETLIKTLPTIEDFEWSREKKDFVKVSIKASARIADEAIQIDGEDGKGLIDYYGEYRGGYPHIHPALEAWAENNGGHWEWNNPGSISFYI